MQHRQLVVPFDLKQQTLRRLRPHDAGAVIDFLRHRRRALKVGQRFGVPPLLHVQIADVADDIRDEQPVADAIGEGKRLLHDFERGRVSVRASFEQTRAHHERAHQHLGVVRSARERQRLRDALLRARRVSLHTSERRLGCCRERTDGGVAEERGEIVQRGGRGFRFDRPRLRAAGSREFGERQGEIARHELRFVAHEPVPPRGIGDELLRDRALGNTAAGKPPRVALAAQVQ